MTFLLVGRARVLILRKSMTTFIENESWAPDLLENKEAGFWGRFIQFC